jgi:hypothetical protein
MSFGGQAARASRCGRSVDRLLCRHGRRPVTITASATYNIEMKILLVPVAALAFAVLSLHGAHAAVPGCPAVAPKPLSSTAPGSGGELVPTGATTLLLCRYHGLNPAATARRLEGMRLVTSGTRIAQIAVEFDSLPRLPRGIIACPFDDGSEIVATFRYPRARADVVDVGLAGCRVVGNGRLSRTAVGSAGARLLARLTALVR